MHTYTHRFLRIFLTRSKARMAAYLKAQKEHEASNPSPASAISQRGMVMKMGRVHKVYRKRYLVLEHGVLRYFREEDLKEGKTGLEAPDFMASGEVSCRGARATLYEWNPPDEHYIFTVAAASGRILMCKCDKHVAAEAWVSNVNAAGIACISHSIVANANTRIDALMLHIGSYCTYASGHGGKG